MTMIFAEGAVNLTKQLIRKLLPKSLSVSASCFLAEVIYTE